MRKLLLWFRQQTGHSSSSVWKRTLKEVWIDSTLCSKISNGMHPYNNTPWAEAINLTLIISWMSSTYNEVSQVPPADARKTFPEYIKECLLETKREVLINTHLKLSYHINHHYKILIDCWFRTWTTTWMCSKYKCKIFIEGYCFSN